MDNLNTYWLNESAIHCHKLRLFLIVFFTKPNIELLENILSSNLINTNILNELMNTKIRYNIHTIFNRKFECSTKDKWQSVMRVHYTFYNLINDNLEVIVIIHGQIKCIHTQCTHARTPTCNSIVVSIDNTNMISGMTFRRFGHNFSITPGDKTYHVNKKKYLYL